MKCLCDCVVQGLAGCITGPNVVLCEVRTECNADSQLPSDRRQQRREADKTATMRKRDNRLSEYLKRYRRNLGRTAHCSGGTFKTEYIVRAHRTKGKCSASAYVVHSPSFTRRTLWECLIAQRSF